MKQCHMAICVSLREFVVFLVNSLLNSNRAANLRATQDFKVAGLDRYRSKNDSQTLTIDTDVFSSRNLGIVTRPTI